MKHMNHNLVQNRILPYVDGRFSAVENTVELFSQGGVYDYDIEK